MITFTQAAARLHFTPAEFSRLRRTYPLSCVQGKGGPTFDPETLDKWFARLPFCVRQSLSNRKPLDSQTRQAERDRNYLMRLWDALRRIAPPLGAICPCFVMKNRHFDLVDYRGRKHWNSLAEAIQGMKLALALARTRSATILKAA